MLNSLAFIRPLRFAVSVRLIPVAIWIVCVAAVDPFGNFPLNDDWSYAIAVQRLLETGQFHPTDWTSTTLLTHVLWGALFSLPFGVSFVTLRFATIVAGALGLWLFGALLRALDCDRRITLLASVTLAFNPVFFALSNTFMTDVGFTTLTIWSVLLFVRYLHGQRTGYLIAALVVALAATMLRQLALFLPMAMVVALLLERPRAARPLWLAVAGVGACAAAIVLLELWFRTHGMLPSTFHTQSAQLVENIEDFPQRLALILRHTLVALLYLGWFTFPVLILRLPGFYRSLRARWTGTAALAGMTVLLVSCLILLTIADRLLPLSENVIVDSGIGPLTLTDAFTLDVAVPSLPQSFWFIVTAMGLIGGAMLALEAMFTVIRLVGMFRARKRNPAGLARAFLVAGVVIYMAPLFVAGYFDRYLLPPAALLLALASMRTPAGTPGAATAFPPFTLRRPRAVTSLVSLAAFVLMMWFSVGGTHDYLNWNRARWELVNTLSASGVPPRMVDGGLEVNGLYLYDPHYRRVPGKSWWWVQSDEYMIAFSRLPGYRVDSSIEVSRWLPPFSSTVFALKRAEH